MSIKIKNINVNVKKLKEDALIPTKESDKSAGYDLYAYCNENSILIRPHETVKIGTGIAIQPPKGYFGAIFARSGIATRCGLRPANCVGVCDEDYTGEYIVALHNDTEEPQVVATKDRIAQVIFLPYINVDFYEVDELDATNRGSNGFGSTGK